MLIRTYVFNFKNLQVCYFLIYNTNEIITQISIHINENVFNVNDIAKDFQDFLFLTCR